MPKQQVGRFKRGAAALGERLKMFGEGSTPTGTVTSTSSSPTSPVGTPSQRRSGGSSGRTPTRTDESPASSSSSPTMESDSSSPKTSRKISEPSDGEEVEHVSNPNAPGHFLGYVTDPERAFETHEDATEWVSIPIDDLVELCYSYLGTLHTTLWADWDISGNDRTKLTSSGKEQGRIVAARWLAEQIENVATLAQEAEDHD